MIYSLLRSKFSTATHKGARVMAVSHVVEDEKALIEAIRELAQERVAPRAAEIDRTEEYPWDMKELLAQQDIFAMPFPVEYGGIRAIKLAVLLAIEEVSSCFGTTGCMPACHAI